MGGTGREERSKHKRAEATVGRGRWRGRRDEKEAFENSLEAGSPHCRPQRGASSLWLRLRSLEELVPLEHLSEDHLPAGEDSEQLGSGWPWEPCSGPHDSGLGPPFCPGLSLRSHSKCDLGQPAVAQPTGQVQVESQVPAGAQGLRWGSWPWARREFKVAPPPWPLWAQESQESDTGSALVPRVGACVPVLPEYRGPQPPRRLRHTSPQASRPDGQGLCAPTHCRREGRSPLALQLVFFIALTPENGVKPKHIYF